MGQSLTYKILSEKLIDGDLVQGGEIAIRINQTLTQDSTGTMAYLQLEAMHIERVQTDLSVAYVDHNTLQAGFENADDHAFIQSAANKYGIIYSKPGGGICHQVHLERFGKPGITLLGSDSHTPTNGGIGALAIGAGGLDVAVAMAKGFYYLKVPKVFNIYLTGELQRGVNAKDVILHILSKLTVKGGTHHVIEYTGPGVSSLSVNERASICNMGAELGATTSIFPSDERTKEYLIKQRRVEDFREIKADDDAVYDEKLEIDLSSLEPLCAKPHSPDNIELVSKLDTPVDQVIIGSCTNSSYSDLMKAATILKGHKVHSDVSLVIAPGSANVLHMLIQNGALADMIEAGARIIESACGPCIGMGQAPRSGAVSLRTFNRNFKGRSGTIDAQVYLVSPETAAFSAIEGRLSDPRAFRGGLDIIEPEFYTQIDNYFIFPESSENTSQIETVKGPNIQAVPINHALENEIIANVVLKAGDNVTTDDIVPSNAKLLPYRSNIPYLAEYSFNTLIDDFSKRCSDNNGGIIVAGSNYGQGSSREHAALVPLYLGIKAVIAKSFARIHHANLINSGILPLVFANDDDYKLIDEYDQLKLCNLLTWIEDAENEPLILFNQSKHVSIPLKLEASSREFDILKLGGYLSYAKQKEI